MENASKALIIAGSILLSILIIALGMYIFSTSSSTSDVSVLSETEIQTFNAKFEKYKGEQLGSNVEALINALRSNATTNKKSTEKLPTLTAVSFASGTSAARFTTGDPKVYITNLTTITNDVQKSHRYTVEMTYDSDGLIDSITITY